MVRKYKTRDGEVIVANTSRAFIRQLRAGNPEPGRNVKEFMEEMALRVRRQTGRRIDTKSPEKFVAGLVRAGLITQEG